eukprot:3535696-Rhodomonas_salina.2
MAMLETRPLAGARSGCELEPQARDSCDSSCRPAHLPLLSGLTLDSSCVIAAVCVIDREGGREREDVRHRDRGTAERGVGCYRGREKGERRESGVTERG